MSSNTTTSNDELAQDIQSLRDWILQTRGELINYTNAQTRIAIGAANGFQSKMDDITNRLDLVYKEFQTVKYRLAYLEKVTGRSYQENADQCEQLAIVAEEGSTDADPHEDPMETFKISDSNCPDSC